RKTMHMLRSAGYELQNADTTICAQAPRLNPHIPQMQECLADVMQVRPDQISIKATTTEHLGFVGRQEGMAAMATVLIYRP
ncbi:MAG: 2-C-methyl-D-erythritol 2,4-cyclodiphosphate synthase, partial [Paludibacteraceae bacterium]|nr:2-C-methyl-D-erythritol 2,4-cyclodiphosphate synthase [Paludibacteraceae bacterium]